MRILMIVPPERRDIYSYLEQDKENEYVLLWHESEKKFRHSEIQVPIFFKKIFFWNQFITPHGLIKKIKPDKICLFEIIDLRQIALIVAANAKRVSTVYIDHGAAGDRETAIKRWDEEMHVKKIKSYLLKRFFTEFRNIVLAKIFYYSVFKFESFKSWIKYILLPLKMLKNLPNKVLSHSVFKERNPTTAIVFSQANFEEFELYTRIDMSNVEITGVPDFDKYYRPSNIARKEYVVYIDSPFYEESLLNWTKEHHAYVAKKLFEFSSKTQTHIYIKLHPRSNIGLWNEYSFDTTFFTIVQFGDYTNLLLDASLILGYISSLITGLLCAKKNIVILSWHPVPSTFGVDFSKFGLSHSSNTPEDLANLYSYWVNNNILNEKDDEYLAFLKRFNYPFDGQATKRILDIITND